MKRTTGNNKELTVADYRRILNDKESTDERIQARLDYLKSLCRNIIRTELEKYKENRKNAIKTH